MNARDNFFPRGSFDPAPDTSAPSPEMAEALRVYGQAWPLPGDVADLFGPLIERRRALNSFLTALRPTQYGGVFLEGKHKQALQIKAHCEQIEPSQVHELPADLPDFRSVPSADSVAQLSQALEVADATLARTLLVAEEDEQAALLKALKDYGIELNQTYEIAGGANGLQRFLLQAVRLSVGTLQQARYQTADAPAIVLRGRVRPNGLSGNSRKMVLTFKNLTDARSALGIPSEAGDQTPRTMSLEAIAAELGSALRQSHPNLGDDGRALFECLEAYRAVKAGTPSDDVLRRADMRNVPIVLTVDITSKDNLVIEWALADGRPHVVHATSKYFGYYRPERLLQLPVGRVLHGHRLRLDWMSPLNAGRYARLHDLWARLAEGTARMAVASIEKAHPVLWRSATPYLADKDGSPGALSVRLAQRASSNPDSPSHFGKSTLDRLLETLTGLSAEDFDKEVPLPLWRHPERVDWAAWQQAVEHRGGHLSRELSQEDKAGILMVYELCDPAEIAARQAAEARAREEVALAAVRERQCIALRTLASVPISARSGWGKALAAALDMHPTTVRGWLERHLPEAFAVMYPDGAARARTPADPTVFLRMSPLQTASDQSSAT